MPTEQIRVSHSGGEYPVVFCSFAEAMAALPTPGLIVTDDNVRRHWGHRFAAQGEVAEVPAGEASKCLGRYGQLVERLGESGAPRSTTIVALGGGVVGDLAGFAAATYMRGVHFVQVPTTLLAQVDSSVGGKVAVDTPQGKNLVGAFYPPSAVYIAVEALQTLPLRQFRNGMAEVLKTAMIFDAPLLDALTSQTISHESPELPGVIARCVRLKKAVVEEDEFDRTGARAVLNFGHTIGHAIEHLTGYGPVLHGEAVAIGMVVEAELGEKLGVTPSGASRVVRDALQRYGLPTTHESLADVDGIIRAVWRDKKVQDGALRFALLTAVGQSKLVTGVTEADVRAALRDA